MIIKKGITYLAGTIFLLFAFGCIGCKEAKVTITKDYVINPNWDEVDNSFQIIRMNFKSVNDSINLQKASPPELLKKLMEDTSFSYTANVKYNGEKYSNRKVYFNRDNGFIWRKPPDIDPYRVSKYETIGELQQETWYLLSGLSNVKTLYYVYLDSLDSLHTFRVPASYWTNY